MTEHAPLTEPLTTETVAAAGAEAAAQDAAEFNSTEAVEYNARQNRKYAQKSLQKALSATFGRSGMTDAEKVQALAEAQEAAQKAVDALGLAMVQVAVDAVKETEEKTAWNNENITLVSNF